MSYMIFGTQSGMKSNQISGLGTKTIDVERMKLFSKDSKLAIHN